MAAGEFSVFQFFPNGDYECVAQLVDGKTAVETAKSYTTRPAALIGIIRRVIITDGGDCCCFEWKYGQGVTFPPNDGKQFVRGESHAE
ncbi:MAG: hypothetical protein GEU95_01050 [Rhizobiales bacterium]|nr:hypothetical protein [Hyphomicrobiales bacterium]